MTTLATHHAPAGYTKNRPLTFQGHKFVGGQFIPDDLVQAMPAAMRAKLEQRSEGLFDEPLAPHDPLGLEPEVQQQSQAQPLAPVTDQADSRVAAALARAEQYPEPHWNDAEANQRASAAFEALPVGTSVVSIDEWTKGQLGRIAKARTIRGKPNGSNRVVLDGQPGFASNHVEPLDEKLSWRVPKAEPFEAQVQTEKPLRVPVDELVRKREEEFAADAAAKEAAPAPDLNALLPDLQKRIAWLDKDNYAKVWKHVEDAAEEMSSNGFRAWAATLTGLPFKTESRSAVMKQLKSFLERVALSHSQVQGVGEKPMEKPEHLKTAASGDPRILERVNIDEDVKRLEADRDRHEREQIKLKRSASESEKQILILKKRAEGLVRDVKHLESQPDFSFKIGGATYDERKDAIAALSVKAKEADDLWANTPSWRRDDFPDAVPMGDYRGFEVVRPIGSKAKGGFLLYGPSGESYSTGDSLSSLEYVARNLPREKTKVDADLERMSADAEKIKASIGKTFAKADELKAKTQRLKELNEALSGKREEKPMPPIILHPNRQQEQAEYPPSEKPNSPNGPVSQPLLEQQSQSIVKEVKEETHYHNRSLGHGRRADIERRSGRHPRVGEVIRTKAGPRIIIKAESPQFISDDWIEDNDAWSEYPDGPGWYAGYETIAGDKLPDSIKIAPEEPRPATKPTTPSDKHVVTGNTFPNREAIKRLGGRWNPNSKTWTIPASAADKLPRGLSSRPVTLSTASIQPRPLVRYRLVFSRSRW